MKFRKKAPSDRRLCLNLAKKTAPNPLRMDPTRTAGIRRQAEREIGAKFTLFKRDLARLILDEDALNLTENVFCATGEGGGVDPTCSKPGEAPTRKKVKYQGQDVTIEVQKDGSGLIVEGPTESIGRVLKKRDPSPAPALSVAAPAPKPASTPASEPVQRKALTNTEEAETAFLKDHSTYLYNRGIPEKDFLEASNYVSETYHRLSDHKAVAAALKARKSGQPQTLEIGVQYSGSERSTSAKYNGRGIELGRGVALNPNEEPVYGQHKVGSGLADSFRHEFGHEVFDRGVPRAKQKEWIRIAEAYKNSSTVSRYGGTNERELFAETFSAYTSPKYKRGSLPADLESWFDKNIRGDNVTANEELYNIFCPTGKGGGVDPTCSPGDVSRVERVERPNNYQRFDVFIGDIKAGYLTVKVWSTTKEVVVKQIEVDEQFRRKGLATKLHETAFQYAQSMGLTYKSDASQMRTGAAENYWIKMVAAGKAKKEEGVYRRVNDELTTNAGRWQALDNRGKMKAFKEWLKSQVRGRILGGMEEIWRKFAEQAWRKGVARAFDDTKAPRKALIEATTEDEEKKVSVKVFEGSRDEFLRSVFDMPVSVQKIQELAARSYNDLEGVTEQMSTTMTRTLVDGLARGNNPRVIARALSADVEGIGRTRALMIARTEIIRAHAEGQLDALEELGVEDVGVMVEWTTTRDAKVCNLCAPLSGITLKLTEARGMLPRHPNCRCAWIPANVGEPSSSPQKRSRRAIEAAVKTSSKREGRDWKPATPISGKRPTRNQDETMLPSYLTPLMIDLDYWLHRQDIVGNVFCSTGKGGGIDPTCTKGGGEAEPYGQEDRKYLNPEEKKDYLSLFNKRQALYKKIKAGTATDDEMKEAEDAKTKLNAYSAIAKKRKAEGVQVETSEKVKKVKEKIVEGKPEIKAEEPKKPLRRSGAYTRAETLGHISNEHGALSHEKAEQFLRDNGVDLPEVQVHGMSKPTKMKQITLDGLMFAWEDGVDVKMVAGTVKAAFDDIHPSLWSSNNLVVFTGQRNKHDAHWEEAYNMPGFHSAATGGDGSICVYMDRGSSIGRSSFIHESGHNLARRAFGSTAPSELSKIDPEGYGYAQAREKPVSSYGANSPAEDFAEACVLRMTRPLQFKQDFPMKAAALERILKKFLPPPPDLS